MQGVLGVHRECGIHSIVAVLCMDNLYLGKYTKSNMPQLTPKTSPIAYEFTFRAESGNAIYLCT